MNHRCHIKDCKKRARIFMQYDVYVDNIFTPKIRAWCEFHAIKQEKFLSVYVNVEQYEEYLNILKVEKVLKQ